MQNIYFKKDLINSNKTHIPILSLKIMIIWTLIQTNLFLYIKKINTDIKIEPCNTYIENKDIKIIKLKKMTLTIWKLKNIYTDLKKLYNLSIILDKNYIVLLFNKYTQKSQILAFKLKNNFFDMFKLSFLLIKSNRDKLGCL